MKVTDPQGKKSGQQLLDGFVEELALNLPKFMQGSNKDKANILLQIIGVGDQLAYLEKEESELYQERLAVGRIADQKVKYAKEQVYFNDMPKDLVSASDLIKEQQEILIQNGENRRKRENLHKLEQRSQELTQKLQAVLEEQKKIEEDIQIARMSATQLEDKSTQDLEKSILEIDEINRKVRANLDKEKAEDDAREYGRQYEELSLKINAIRDKKVKLLNAADLPLEGLSVADGELIYNNHKWDNLSGSDQLKVATAIVRKLNPNCGFVLLDKLEQMDMVTLKDFGLWLEAEGLQAIATRVSTGDECSILIEDGYVVGEEKSLSSASNSTEWKAGEF